MARWPSGSARESAFFTHPEGKDIDEQMVIDLRRLLSQAGYEPS